MEIFPPEFINCGLIYIANSKYKIEFIHDWPDGDFEKYFPEIYNKYRRRINRFCQLDGYPGKVYFIRVAYYTDAEPCSSIHNRESTKINSA